MIKRSIMIFPDFKNSYIIKKIRDQFDPLSKIIPPHITLVFPFDSELSSSELKKHIKSAVKDFVPFQITMAGITANIEQAATYLFLNITQGEKEVNRLSQKLYTGILQKYQLENFKEIYCPHITVGKLDKNVDYEYVLSMIENKDTVFETTVNSIYVEIIGNDDSSSIETKVLL